MVVVVVVMVMMMMMLDRVHRVASPTTARGWVESPIRVLPPPRVDLHVSLFGFHGKAPCLMGLKVRGELLHTTTRVPRIHRG